MVFQKEEMELRAAMRSRASTRPKRRAGAGGAPRARHDDSEDEGGVSLAAIKNKYKQGQKGYTFTFTIFRIYQGRHI